MNITTDPEKIKDALNQSVSAIYFDNRSNFRSYHWHVIQALCPEAAQMIEDGKEQEVYDALNPE